MKTHEGGERLQKLIAHSGVASRRKAEEMIKDGRVKVNGEIVRELGAKASRRDHVTVDGEPIRIEPPAYYLFYKPEGVVSSVRDDRGRRTVLDYVHARQRVYPVGRLDYDASGLMLLTNDGEVTLVMTHPSYGVEKEYDVTVEGFIRKPTSKRLAKGIELDGEKSAPAKVRQVEYIQKTGRSRFTLSVVEGRYHHVKRLLESVGHPVRRLKRIRHGPLTLDDLAKGDHRPLKPHEIKKLRRLAETARKDA